MSIHFAKGCSADLRSEIKAVLGVQNEALSDKYLGMPTNVGTVNGAFKYLKDRVWQKVQGWMEQCLSAGVKRGSNQGSSPSHSNLLHVMLQASEGIM